MEEPHHATRLTADELAAAITDLARNGEGADRRWAINLLREEAQSSTDALPAPLNDGEVVERLARLMRGAGIGITRAAYVKAFGSYSKVRNPPKPETNDLDIDVDSLPRTLREYYRRYPEYKKHGFPEGYPMKDPVKQMKFVQKLSMEREREKLAAKYTDIVTGIDNLQDLPTDGNETEGTGNTG